MNYTPSRAIQAHNKFWDDIKPARIEYLKFWMDLFIHLGFTVAPKKVNYSDGFEATFTRKDGTSMTFEAHCRPTICQGIIVYNNSLSPCKMKFLSENGVIKFCKRMNLT
jgi:hypothetical protein